MDLLGVYSHFWRAILAYVGVAEWSKASDLFRSFGQKLRWALENEIFFFKIFFLIWGQHSFLPLFFNPMQLFYQYMWPFSLKWHHSLAMSLLCCIAKYVVTGIGRSHNFVKSSVANHTTLNRVDTFATILKKIGTYTCQSIASHFESW